MRVRVRKFRIWSLTKLLRAILHLLVKLKLFHVSTHGNEHIPATGAGIIASNHLSYADPPIIWGSIRRPVVAVAMRELWRTPMLPLMVALNHIPIDRGNVVSGEKARQRMRDVVNAGGLLLIFPEGKISRDGELLPLKRGATDIAWELDAPIVPAGIAGSNELWPVGRRWVHRRQHVVVHYGTPLLPSQFTSSEEMRCELARCIVELASQAEATRSAA